MWTRSCGTHVGSSSLTRYRTQAPCIGSVESYPLCHQGSPPSLRFYCKQVSLLYFTYGCNQLPLSWALGQVNFWVWLFKRCFSDCLHLVGLRPWAQLVFKIRCFGGSSQVRVLKVVVPDVGFEPFVSQGEALGFEFPPSCGLPYWGWGLWQDCEPTFPTCFDVVFFLFAWYVVVTQPAFSFF